jgi:hypothetical protein
VSGEQCNSWGRTGGRRAGDEERCSVVQQHHPAVLIDSAVRGGHVAAQHAPHGRPSRVTVERTVATHRHDPDVVVRPEVRAAGHVVPVEHVEDLTLAVVCCRTGVAPRGLVDDAVRTVQANTGRAHAEHVEAIERGRSPSKEMPVKAHAEHCLDSPCGKLEGCPWRGADPHACPLHESDTCGGCDKVSTPSGLALHQRGTRLPLAGERLGHELVPPVPRGRVWPTQPAPCKGSRESVVA